MHKRVGDCVLVAVAVEEKEKAIVTVVLNPTHFGLPVEFDERRGDEDGRVVLGTGELPCVAVRLRVGSTVVVGLEIRIIGVVDILARLIHAAEGVVVVVRKTRIVVDVGLCATQLPFTTGITSSHQGRK